MFHLPTLTIIDRSSGAAVGNRIRFADTAIARLVGLLGAAKLLPGEGLLLAPSSGVHTCGMSYPIDVVALDRLWRVCRMWERVPPWRILGPSLAIRRVLELPAGRIQELQIQLGDEFSALET